MKRETEKIDLFEVGIFIVGFIIFIGLYGLCGYSDSTYKKEVEVVEKYDNVILLEDAQGELWEFDNYDCKVGDMLTATFFNNRTYDNKYDDEILKLKKNK